MDKIKISVLASIIIFSSAPIFAKQVTCPPASVVKSVKFVRAIDYDSSINLWEVLSEPFMHDGVQWDVAFGMEFPGVTTADKALAAAQAAYQNAAIINPQPEAIDIPGHVFCDYTVEGMQYWIQTLSPPGE